jgi:hypothetical protein
MRVLLLGGTGNLGRRCIPALVARNHTVTLYVRNPTKLRSLVSATLLRHVSIVIGDATNCEDIKRALLDYDIEGIINVAGNLVWPWREFLLPKIAKAVSDAAIAVGRDRGHPLRVWITCGLGIMDCPGAPGLIQDYLPKVVGAQHDATRAVIDTIPTTSLRWTLIAISMMRPLNPKQGLFEPLSVPQPHNLLAKADSLPDLQPSWLSKVPFIGWYLDMGVTATFAYVTFYENVAGFLAEDLTYESEFVGKKVAVKEQVRAKRAKRA